MKSRVGQCQTGVQRVDGPLSSLLDYCRNLHGVYNKFHSELAVLPQIQSQVNALSENITTLSDRLDRLECALDVLNEMNDVQKVRDWEISRDHELARIHDTHLLEYSRLEQTLTREYEKASTQARAALASAAEKAALLHQAKLDQAFQAALSRYRAGLPLGPPPTTTTTTTTTTASPSSPPPSTASPTSPGLPRTTAELEAFYRDQSSRTSTAPTTSTTSTEPAVEPAVVAEEEEADDEHEDEGEAIRGGRASRRKVAAVPVVVSPTVVDDELDAPAASSSS